MKNQNEALICKLIEALYPGEYDSIGHDKTLNLIQSVQCRNFKSLSSFTTTPMGYNFNFLECAMLILSVISALSAIICAYQALTSKARNTGKGLHVVICEHFEVTDSGTIKKIEILVQEAERHQ